MNLSKYQLEKLRGYPLDDEDVKYVIDVFGPMLAEHGIHFSKNVSPTADEHNDDDESIVVTQLADRLSQHKFEIINMLRLKKPYYIYIIPEDCHGNPKDALFIAKESFKLTGSDPDECNFTVDYDKFNKMFKIAMTLK